MKKLLWLAILIAFSFVLMGCPDNDKNNGPIRVKFEFRGERFDAARNINARTLNSLDDIDFDTFEDLNNFYDSLGVLKEAYTPTEFTLYINIFQIYNREHVYNLSLNEHINFNNPIIFELSEYDIAPGTYHGLFFQPFYHKQLTAFGNADSSATFTVPGGVGLGHPLENSVQWIYQGSASFNVDWRYDLIVTGDTYKIAPRYLFPDWSSYLTGRPWVNCGNNLYYFYSNKLILLSNKIGDDIERELVGMPDGPLLQYSTMTDRASNLIAPFAGITIPEDASYVKFIVYLDLENIIERYEGDTTATSDDIYIMANKFWERLHMTAEIEYHELEDVVYIE